MTAARYDVLVIGSGPGGYRAAVLAALRGMRVAIVERQDWGGCCLNRGCVPKKAWYHSAKWLAASRDYAARGLRGAFEFDFNAAWAHQERLVATVQDSYLDYMKRLGIATYRGAASFIDANHVRIDSATEYPVVEAAYIVVATGSHPHVPAQFALSPRLITTDALFDAPPPTGERVAIIGGGVIATEFAFILRSFGKEIVWLSRRAPLANSRFSAQALAALAAALSQQRVPAPLRTELTSISTRGNGVRIELSDGTSIDADWALLATGRRPNTGGLGLERAGIKLNSDGFIATHASLQTDAATIYAIGDCVGPSMTANQALADAAVAVDNIARGKQRARLTHWVPEAVYSAVELARVGMNEQLAEDADLEPAIGFSSFAASPSALGQDDTAGFVRIIADMDSGALLGGEIVGGDAAELIHLLSTAADTPTALRAVANSAFNHPARAEEFLNAIETLASKWNLMDRIFTD